MDNFAVYHASGSEAERSPMPFIDESSTVSVQSEATPPIQEELDSREIFSSNSGSQFEQSLIHLSTDITAPSEEDLLQTRLQEMGITGAEATPYTLLESSADEAGAEEMTVPRFLSKLRHIMDHPQGKLGRLVRLLEDNDRWISNNKQEVTDWLVEHDNMSGLFSLLKFCQDEIRYNPNLGEPVKAVHCIYHMLQVLINLNFFIYTLEKCLCEFQFPALIAHHLDHLQNDYMADQMLYATVMKGLDIFYWCAWTTSPKPVVREQTVTTVNKYLKHAHNRLETVMKSIDIIKLMETPEQLADRDWPDSLLQAFSDLIARAQCNDAGDFTATYNKDGTGSWAYVSIIMSNLKVISMSRSAICQVINMLHQHQEILQKIMKKRHGIEIITNSQLRVLSTHSCRQCKGGRWAKKLLGDESDDGISCIIS